MGLAGLQEGAQAEPGLWLGDGAGTGAGHPKSPEQESGAGMRAAGGCGGVQVLTWRGGDRKAVEVGTENAVFKVI